MSKAEGAAVAARHLNRDPPHKGTIAAVAGDTYTIAYDDGDREEGVVDENVFLLGQCSDLQAGTTVWATFQGGTIFYRAKVAGDNGDLTFRLDYDDGDKDMRVPLSVIFLDVHRKPTVFYNVGDVIQATWKGSTRLYTGRIVGVHEDGETYDVQYDDGDRDKVVPWSCISPLTEEQVVALNSGTVRSKWSVMARRWRRQVTKWLPGVLWSTGGNGRPAHWWLGLPNSPRTASARGVLRTGLAQCSVDDWIIVDSEKFAKNIQRKEKIFASDAGDELLCVREDAPDIMSAQELLLDMLASHLEARFPSLYDVQRDDTRAVVSVHVHLTGKTYSVEDYAAMPLRMCSLLVEEDLILMRNEPGKDEEGKADNDVQVMEAASVCFSFGGVRKRLGVPMKGIHMNVPHFEKDLRSASERTMARVVRQSVLRYRTNWGLRTKDPIDKSCGLRPGEQRLEFLRRVGGPGEAMKLKVEYQTLRRLPKCGDTVYTLFTVHTMACPLSDLETVPPAARGLARNIRSLPEDFLKYKGFGNEDYREEVLSYLDGIPSFCSWANVILALGAAAALAGSLLVASKKGKLNLSGLSLAGLA